MKKKYGSTDDLFFTDGNDQAVAEKTAEVKEADIVEILEYGDGIDETICKGCVLVVRF